MEAPRTVASPQPFEMKTGIGHGRGLLLLFTNMGRLFIVPCGSTCYTGQRICEI